MNNVLHIKTSMQSFCYTSVKSQPIFKILSQICKEMLYISITKISNSL